jgi:hypothetical protein
MGLFSGRTRSSQPIIIASIVDPVEINNGDEPAGRLSRSFSAREAGRRHAIVDIRCIGGLHYYCGRSELERRAAVQMIRPWVAAQTSWEQLVIPRG